MRGALRRASAASGRPHRICLHPPPAAGKNRYLPGARFAGRPERGLRPAHNPLGHRQGAQRDFAAVAQRALNDGAMIVNPRQADLENVLELFGKGMVSVHGDTRDRSKPAGYFSTGATYPWKCGAAPLKALKSQILAEENELKAALKQDLNKSGFEAYMAEIGMVLDELGYAIKHLKGWARPERVGTPWPSSPAAALL